MQRHVGRCCRIERYKFGFRRIEMKHDIQLRDYQQEMLERIHHAWEKHQSVMVQMPTGVGKTHLMAEAINQFKIQNSWMLQHQGAIVVAEQIFIIHNYATKRTTKVRTGLRR